jgi:hypothetical protein
MTGQQGTQRSVGIHQSGSRKPKLVELKTGLRGLSIDAIPLPKRSVRSQTEKELLARDSDVQYSDAEKANRNLICSLIERQDRVVEQLLLHINDLQYRVDDLELAFVEFTGKPGDPEKEGPE